MAVSDASTLTAFGSSLTAITLAELGDKTFFMALILAVRHRPRWVFIGAFAALTVVTLLSLAVGFGLRELLPMALLPLRTGTLLLLHKVLGQHRRPARRARMRLRKLFPRRCGGCSFVLVHACTRTHACTRGTLAQERRHAQELWGGEA